MTGDNKDTGNADIGNTGMDKSLNTVKWILLASLLINAAFAGFVFSRVTNRFGFGFGEPHPGPVRQMVVRGNFKNPEATEQTRAVLNKVFASEKGDMERAVREWIAARRKAVQVLRAEPLDKTALEAALADMRAKTVNAQEVYHRVVLQAAPELSAEERVLLARILNASPNRFGSSAVLTPNQPGSRSGEMRPSGPHMMPPGEDMPNMMPPPGEGGGPMGPPPPPKP